MLPAQRHVGPRDWILSLFGSLVRDAGGWIAVADLLTLLETLGSESAASRAAISRMKGNNELLAESRAGRNGYSLTTEAEEWFRYGSERILRPQPAPVTTSWILVSFSVPEDDRQARYKIRARLKALGFGQVSPGLMIAPAALEGEMERALIRAGLQDYVVVWNAEHRGFTSTERLVAAAWDLPEIRAAFEGYLQFGSVLLDLPIPDTQERAFVSYLTAIQAWRELPFLDPGLPALLLPDDWPAAEALRVYQDLSGRLREPAFGHATSVMAGSEGVS